MSRPAWGAWIEIEFKGAKEEKESSRPAWGAWIEIEFKGAKEEKESESRPAWGAWIEILESERETSIRGGTPRMGRVD